MILAPATVARVATLVVLAVVLQISGVQGVELLGTNADLVPLVLGALALWGGSIAGAVAGFGCGLLLDLLLGQDLGSSSLVLTAVGYWVGRYGELNEPAHGLLPVPIGAAATAGYLIGTTIVSLMLAFDASVSVLAFRDMFITILINSILALPVFALVRRIIRPVLAREPVERSRRRAKPAEAGPIGLRGLEI